ncbi:A24 family peptidase [Agromyces sp. LHK192]|uniref:prepilin peptidase n=1 Tax=Agromyces sp. LHK192 TaxID=2498704 RepID=UPI000FD92BAA|nr:A24 family peptidase [Agromyces sp. LHK192]
MSTALLTISTALVATVGVLGLAIGSFLNVVVHRVPAGLSVVSPRSSCPDCRSPIRGRDNVPVLSWLLLAGRCRDCRSPISARYPLVEAFTGVAFAAIAGWVVAGGAGGAAVAPGSASGSPLEGGAVGIGLVILLVLAAVSIALTLIDLDTHRLPNVIVGWAAVVLGCLVFAASVIGGDLAALGRALLGGAALFSGYLVVALVSRGGLGMGDVKLAGVLGLVLGYFGWPQLAVGAFAAFALGGVAGILLIVTGRARRGDGIPFGPWMLAGAWAGLVGGPAVADWYLRLAGFG